MTKTVNGLTPSYAFAGSSLGADAPLATGAPLGADASLGAGAPLRTMNLSMMSARSSSIMSPGCSGSGAAVIAAGLSWLRSNNAGFLDKFSTKN